MPRPHAPGIEPVGRASRRRRLAFVAGVVAALSAAGTASADTTFLGPGTQLNPGQMVASPKTGYVLAMQTDGNLVMIAPGNRPIWWSGTHIAGTVLQVQSDGNVVLYAPGHNWVWSTGTTGRPGAGLGVGDDGTLSVVAPGGVTVWRVGGGGASSGGTVSLRSPLAVSRPTSEFGMRTDPVTHRYTLHAGIDLRASMETPVYAAAAGTVVTAGWVTGYGNYVCIRHDAHTTTCYAHLGTPNSRGGQDPSRTGMLVRVGQQVGAGQQVATSGRTGWVTGPHLHFEVRIDGKPNNPRGYLAF